MDRPAECSKCKAALDTKTAFLVFGQYSDIPEARCANCMKVLFDEAQRLVETPDHHFN